MHVIGPQLLIQHLHSRYINTNNSYQTPPSYLCPCSPNTLANTQKVPLIKQIYIIYFKNYLKNNERLWPVSGWVKSFISIPSLRLAYTLSGYYLIYLAWDQPGNQPGWGWLPSLYDIDH